MERGSRFSPGLEKDPWICRINKLGYRMILEEEEEK